LVEQTDKGKRLSLKMKRLVKKIMKEVVPPLFWGIGRKIKNNTSKYYSLNGLDKKIEKYLPQHDGFYVELGANDGVDQSNTLYFERHKNWRGVLIEPTPHNYLKCLANRSKKNQIFCNACVSFEYKDRFVEIAFSNLMSSPIGLESDVLDPISHAESGKQFLEFTDKVFTFGSIAKTLNAILHEAQAPHCIDFMSLDVEGAEMEVLKGIDHATYRFKYMCIECRDIAKLTDYLEPLGYELKEKLSVHDYLFADKTLID
jgi:FkbM family methyltransferase